MNLILIPGEARYRKGRTEHWNQTSAVFAFWQENVDSAPLWPRGVLAIRDPSEAKKEAVCLRAALLASVQRDNAPHCENVSQEEICPVFRPAVSHLARAAEEPWVKLSGTA